MRTPASLDGDRAIELKRPDAATDVDAGEPLRGTDGEQVDERFVPRTAAEPIETPPAEPVAAAPREPEPEPVAIVLTPPDPDRPKRAGWWSKAKSALGG
jgi:ribonuclease E